MTLGQRFSRDGGPPAGPVKPHASKLHGGSVTCLDIIKALTLCPCTVVNDSDTMRGPAGTGLHLWSNSTVMDCVTAMGTDGRGLAL